MKTELTKLYYSIGEVSEMFDVSPSLIRYWESEFTHLRPKKNRKGDRQFTKKDIENLRRIYILVKERGFTLEGAKRELKNPTINRSKEDAKTRLIQLSKKLKNLRDEL
ncbi:MAG TPA: MerR family transcriptional regulator [Saprospiraceae bacterium]|nr:MerR family transcriptional regulator [Saprospiraceae bacterium]